MSNTHTDILLAGAFAAFSVDLLVYPLDTLKTRIQSPDYRRIYTVGVNQAVNKRLLFRGLYQGVGGVILATLPSSGAFFTTYEAVKSGLTKHNPVSSQNGSPLLPQPLIHATASSVGELVSCFILTPAEVIKQNAQMINRAPSLSSSTSSPSTNQHTTSATSTFRSNATFQALRRFEHPTQLWRGYTALVARNLPFTAMQFPLFEHLKTLLKTRRLESSSRSTKSTAPGQLSLVETGSITALSAGSAGALSAVLTTPIDVVKTRIMLNAANDRSQPQPLEALKHKMSSNSSNPSSTSSSTSSSKPRPSGWSVFRTVLREEGFRGIWRGGALRGTWTAIGSGLYLGVYESGRVYLEDRRRDKDERD